MNGFFVMMMQILVMKRMTMMMMKIVCDNLVFFKCMLENKGQNKSSLA